MAQTIVIGRITADLEMKTSANGNPYVRFDLVENIGSKENSRPQYFQICAWSDDAKRIVKARAKKGSLIWVSGSLELETFTKRDGITTDKRGCFKSRTKLIRVHDIRHSHAAMLVDLGYSIVAVAERLGDTVEVAMSTYSHLYPDKMDTLAVDLEQRAGGTGRQEVGLGDVADALEKAEKEAGKK